MTPEFLVFADDLTGALESGAAFSQRGIPSVVAWGQQYSFDVPVLVIDTETRHASAALATEKITSLLKKIPARLIYKKTDSTLRGNIRAELLALAQLGPVTFVPAYPKLGRTVHQSQLYVHGMPIETTEFAHDPIHPVADGNLNRLLGEAENILISESNTDAAIKEVARNWLQKGGLAAGPSAMLHAAASILAITPQTPAFPGVKKALVVLGSRNPCSLQQVTIASRLFSDFGWELMRAETEFQGDPLAFAGHLGGTAADRLATGKFDACLIVGGDTAFATLNALGHSSLEPIGEVIPGIPVATLPSGLTLITKAGGFGSPHALLELQQQLNHV